MSSGLDITQDRCNQVMDELRDAVKKVDFLHVELYGDKIDMTGYVSPQPNPEFNISCPAPYSSLTYNRIVRTIGEILEQNLPQLTGLGLDNWNIFTHDFPNLWEELATNRVLKEITLKRASIPNNADTLRFLANPSLASLKILSCSFDDGMFASFCEGIASSSIQQLDMDDCTLEEGESWGSLWSALEHGATQMESLSVCLAENTVMPSMNRFERFLTNNTTLRHLRPRGFFNPGFSMEFVGALGRALVVNNNLKRLELPFFFLSARGPSQKHLIETLFVEGFEQNRSVEHLDVHWTPDVESVDALADGLESMIRHRMDAAPDDSQSQAGTSPVLQELSAHFFSNNRNTSQDVVVAFDHLLDRLARNGTIPIKKVGLETYATIRTIPQKAADFIRSTLVTESLEVSFSDSNANDAVYGNLAEAMETNDCIVELTMGKTQFHRATHLLFLPNRYRIRCQCRRNEVEMSRFRTDSTQHLVPLVLSKLLTEECSPADDRHEVEARQMVDRSLAFELMKDLPVLFAAHGKRKRDD